MDALYGTGVTAEELEGLDRESIVAEFLDDASRPTREREREFEAIQEGLMRDLERYMVLQVVDVRWREHLENMDYMREGIHLRSMAQKDPLVEYRNEGHILFQELNRVIRQEVIGGALPHPDRDRRAAAAASLRAAPGHGRQRRRGALTYEHQTIAGSQAIAAAGGGEPAARERRPAAAGGQVRAGEHRTQRPLLVRIGQEVQALPRRLTARRLRRSLRSSGDGRPRTDARGATRGNRGPACLGP